MRRLRKDPSPARPRRKARATRRGTWQLLDANARFSEVIRLALQEGPQRVTVDGREEVVVISADHFRRLANERTGQVLVDAMQRLPHGTVNMEPPRLRMLVRHVGL